MTPFSYVRPRNEREAVAALARPGAVAIAGGTTLVDLMRLEVMQPQTVVDLGALPLADVAVTPHAVKIGALATNTDVAYHPAIVQHFPALSEALLAGASTQLRNMATVGGNLMQRTRCPYFRDVGAACNKREPNSGCSALDGYARGEAVLGTSRHCIAAHPSDMCVALVALDAVVHIANARGSRTVPIASFHLTPGNHPHVDTVLGPGDLVTHVELAVTPLAARSRYLKVRDRASFAFALASAAVALEVVTGRVRDVRIAFGGVATKPWRDAEAERALVGKRLEPEIYRHAAEVALRGAEPRPDNAFKIALARRTLIRALELAGGTS